MRRAVAAIARAARVAVVGAAAGSTGLGGAACGRPREPASTPQRIGPGSATGSSTAQASPEPAGAGQRDATRGAGTGPDRREHPSDSGEGGEGRDQGDGNASVPSERLAAIQKAMNELDEAAQQCWAAAATERFDIEGEITLQIDIAPGRARASVVHDTARNTKLAACVVQILAAYRWAPPLYGQAIQLPFKFRAPDGQNTIDRALVAWNGQGKGRSNVSVAVLLDENNTGSDAASMFELAIAAGGTTSLRRADRAELWYFLGAGQVASPTGGGHAARGGALPTPEVSDAGDVRSVRGASGSAGRRSLRILRAAAARTQGPETIYADAAAIPDRTLSASILAIPAGTSVAEHLHAGEAAVLYLLAGTGTLTVHGVDLPVTPTSVVQIPRNTRHAFVATTDVRAVLIYTPAGPEQGLKAHP
jgi:quercetin dioxygenase-like cupin family protein